MKIPEEGLPLVGSLKNASKTWPFVLDKMEFNAEGTVDWRKDKSGAQAGPQAGAEKDIGLKVSKKLAEGKWLTEEAVSLAPKASAKGTFELTSSKTELSTTFALSAFAHVFEDKLTIVGLDWSKETLEKEGGPTGKLLENRIGGGFEVPIPIKLDDGTEVDVKVKAIISATFKPNWPRILELLLEGLSSEALVAAAGVAGVGLLAYMSYIDMNRRSQLRAQVARMAQATYQAANSYGGVMIGEKAAEGKEGRLSTKAAAQAGIDLDAKLAEWGLDRGQYLTMLDMAGSKDLIFSETSQTYAESALSAYRDRVFQDVSAWHDEHWFKSFMSGGSTGQDMAEVDDVIRYYKSTGGHGAL